MLQNWQLEDCQFFSFYENMFAWNKNEAA